ncbi:MAG: DUF937 domain-containing protein [Acidobacteriota bacterium]
MDLLNTILNAQGGRAVDQIGEHVGLDRAQTVSAIETLLPSLAGGLSRNAAQPGGLESLVAALASGAHQQYVSDPSQLAQPAAIQDGNNILGHILGSKDASRGVAAEAAATTGIGADVLRKMLPMLASLAMGAMSQRGAARSWFGGSSTGGGGLMGMLAPMLDRNRDGSVGDDLMGMLGQAFKK